MWEAENSGARWRHLNVVHSFTRVRLAQSPSDLGLLSQCRCHSNRGETSTDRLGSVRVLFNLVNMDN